jgi:hypothetical protein
MSLSSFILNVPKGGNTIENVPKPIVLVFGNDVWKVVALDAEKLEVVVAVEEADAGGDDDAGGTSAGGTTRACGPAAG